MAESSVRRILQLAVATPPGGDPTLYVLDDQGQVWDYSRADSTWAPFPPVPGTQAALEGGVPDPDKRRRNGHG